MAKKFFKKKELDPIEEIRRETLKACILQDLNSKYELLEDKDSIEKEINSLLSSKNDSVLFKTVVEKTNILDIGEKTDRIIFPGVRTRKEIKDIHIESLKFNEPMRIFEEDFEDIFYTNAKVVWETANIVLMYKRENSIILFTDDCHRYKIDFVETDIDRAFREIGEIGV